VDAYTGRYFAQAIAERVVAERPGWHAVLAPTLHLGTFAFDAVGTVTMRQRVVRDLLVDYGSALARAGFRHLLISNGHGGPGHLVALEEASAIVSRRYGMTMASVTGYLAWGLMSGRYVRKFEAALGRPITDEELQAFSEDAHGGWWETSMMLLLRPDLVGGGWRDLPAARYSMAHRLIPNYPVRNGGQGYVGHPALADPEFAKATLTVLMDEAMGLVRGLLDGTVRPSHGRSPFFAMPFFRTNFWPVAAGVGAVALALLFSKKTQGGKT
jgi:creatinine amidohydrolase/Fe(II)-dependent formamide hydrolase-like protein